MILFAGRGILLDIEGTTSSISFVYDEMFPFVRRELEQFLNVGWQSEAVQEACELVARDAGYPSLSAWGAGSDGELQELVCSEVIRLMDDDVKATGLKRLQGLIWRQGFESGELQAHLYDDVPPALRQWQAAGIDIRIYSSGSVQAQKLFFGNTAFGDLLALFKGHYDTTTGAKRDASSYSAIAREFSLEPSQILFLSDVTAEVDAARAAGMETVLCLRPGNADVGTEHGHNVIRQFSELSVVQR